MITIIHVSQQRLPPGFLFSAENNFNNNSSLPIPGKEKTERQRDRETERGRDSSRERDEEKERERDEEKEREKAGFGFLAAYCVFCFESR
jgi:hypothetical protein